MCSVMGSSRAIAALHTITRVFSGRGKRRRRKSTPEGELSILTGRNRNLAQQKDSVKSDLLLNNSRFVEMLESHHALVVKGLQKLYKHCVNKEGFPGEPLAEGADGYPLTHEILDRLGLIKQAEESPDELEESTLEDLRYLQVLSASTETSSQSDPSPEPVTPPNPSPVTAKMATTTSTMTSSACSSMMPSPSMGGDISWQQWPWPEPELPSPAFSHLFPDYDYAGSVQLPTALSPSMTTAPFHAQLHNLPAQYPHHHGQGSSLPLFFISGGMHNEHTPVPAPLPASMSVETGHPHYPFG